MNYLGIDWGLKKVGLALAHEETGVALPYGVLVNDHLFLKHLKEVIVLENVSTIVMGSPGYAESSVSWEANQRFVRSLKQVLSLKIVYQNEMFTTKSAHRNLVQRGMKNIAQHDDEESARIILQEWLDKKRDIFSSETM